MLLRFFIYSHRLCSHSGRIPKTTMSYGEYLKLHFWRSFPTNDNFQNAEWKAVPMHALKGNLAFFTEGLGVDGVCSRNMYHVPRVSDNYQAWRCKRTMQKRRHKDVRTTEQTTLRFVAE